MSTKALYRKYRPESFKEVLGQEHITKVLDEALALDKISHAYLFSGSRGTGKTSVARILAREIGCTPNDLYEIDAASNRGIDDIRELKESVGTMPFDSKYKVYIIDEVHMLTKEAFNALLKTLEEPPKHVVFILATTELHKVPDTIVSRCQTYVFRKPAEQILKKMIFSIVKSEGLQIDEEGTELIALLGDGSFRDTLGILDKAISFATGKKLTREEIEKVTGAPSKSLVNDLIGALLENDLEKGFAKIKETVEQGIEMKVYLKLVIHQLRLILLLRYAPNFKKEIESKAGETDLKFFEKVLSEDKKGIISSKTLSVFLDCYDNREYFIPELPLELALLKILVQNR